MVLVPRKLFRGTTFLFVPREPPKPLFFFLSPVNRRCFQKTRPVDNVSIERHVENRLEPDLETFVM